MRRVFLQAESWRRAGMPVALATLVAVRGSSPTRVGSRMAVARSGHMVGSVSGGCVEGDVLAHALEVIESGSPRLAHYGITDEAAIAVGLSCGGAIDVWIEAYRDDPVWPVLAEALGCEAPVALATALAPFAWAGRKLLVDSRGGTTGSIDPRVDAAVRAKARELLAGGDRDVCPIEEGNARVFLQVFFPPPRLFLVGATQTAVHLARWAKELGFRVVVVDPRGVFATRDRFPHADEILLEWPERALDRPDVDSNAFVVTLSHDPKFDVPTLVHALRRRARYVGALGSRRTHAHRCRRLRAEGVTDQELKRIHAPVGLDIGAASPEEIALAILAEMLAVRSGRRGGPLREREGRSGEEC